MLDKCCFCYGSHTWEGFGLAGFSYIYRTLTLRMAAALLPEYETEG